jgi:hypothetical protein
MRVRSSCSCKAGGGVSTRGCPDKIPQLGARQVQVAFKIVHCIVQAPAAAFTPCMNGLRAQHGQLLDGVLAHLFKGGQQGLKIRAVRGHRGRLLPELREFAAEFLEGVGRACPIRGGIVGKVRLGLVPSLGRPFRDRIGAATQGVFCLAGGFFEALGKGGLVVCCASGLAAERYGCAQGGDYDSSHAKVSAAHGPLVFARRAEPAAIAATQGPRLHGNLPQIKQN